MESPAEAIPPAPDAPDQEGADLETRDTGGLATLTTSSAFAARPLNALDNFSLKGRSDEIEKLAVAEIPVLGRLALAGQLTVFYAAPNTGKTLITLSLLLESIHERRVDGSSVYYLNMDDSSRGLVDKIRIGEEYGFHLLAEGHLDFSASRFHSYIMELIKRGHAQNIIIILDTLKKFVDLMDKTRSSGLTKLLRSFALKGGTVIALAHTNKHPGNNGKLVYGGVSDILNDFDCAYIITPIAPQDGTTGKVVEFENIKRRGDVVQTVAYSYSAERDITYNDLLLSVQPVSEDKLGAIKQSAQLRSDAEVIEIIEAFIRNGIKTKMMLVIATTKRAGISRRRATQILEHYTGDDPLLHRWQFSMRSHGAKEYSLIGPNS
jgi:hypothetical protein